MHFRVSACIEPFGNSASPSWSFSLSSPFPFSASFLFISNRSFSHFSLTLSVLSLISPLRLIVLPLFRHCSVSVLLCFTLTWTGGRAAGLLHPCVRDGNHRGDVRCGHAVWHSTGRPHPALSRMTCVHAPLVAISKYWGKGIKDNYTTNMYPSLTGW